MVRNNKNIEGIHIGQAEWRISQFADDTTCFANSERSVIELLRTIEGFSNFSGLRLNLEKSAIIALGPSRNVPTSIQGIRVREKVKILGVWFARERSQDQHTKWNFFSID